MGPQQFREYGYAVIDWIADYYKNIETLPVLSQVKPGEIRQAKSTERAVESVRKAACQYGEAVRSREPG